MEDEIEIEEDFDSLIIADFEWQPQINVVNWNQPDFAEQVTKRLRGMTEEDFAKEVDLWKRYIASLPVYNEFEIRKEISQWHIGIPPKEDFNFETYTLYYFLQCQYKERLNQIFGVIFAHYEMISQAQKTLKEMAVKISAGTTKYDKDAIASFTVSLFTIAMSDVKKLLVYLEAINKNIDFAATQMDRVLKEHQAMTRYNQSFANEGMSALYSRNSMPKSNNNSNSAEIKTRNNRLK